jgi:hypothetical protein
MYSLTAAMFIGETPSSNVSVINWGMFSTGIFSNGKAEAGKLS